MPPAAGTRQRILETASYLFWSQGYHATGIKVILEEAGATSGSLYHFFPTKVVLLLEVLDNYKTRLQDDIIRPASEQTADPIERVFAILDFYRCHLEDNDCALGCPIGNAAAELSDSHPQVRRKVGELFTIWTEGVKECLVGATECLPAEVDAQELAELVLTIMEGGVMQARAQRSLAPFDASVRHLRHYFELLLQECVSEKQARL